MSPTRFLLGVPLTLTLGLALGLFLGPALDALSGGAASAAESTARNTDHDTASLVSDADSFVPGRTLQVGLRLRLAPGWHTYWLNPGDAGDAPTLAVATSGAITAASSSIDWPTPQRLPDGPLMSYGYTGDALLPVAVRLGRAGTAGGDRLHVSAHAEWLACANVCVPESGTFQLDLPRGTGAASAQAPLFAQARAAAPLPLPFAASFSEGRRSGGAGGNVTLRLSGDGLGPRSVRDAWFLPAAPGLINQAAAQPVAITAGQVAIGLHPEAPLAAMQRLQGVVVLRDPAGRERNLSLSAARIAAPPEQAGAEQLPAVQPAAGLPRLLLLALLGGVILNLMPCVFPVLAMKALALSRMSGAARTQMRRSAAFYTAGVLVAFAALGGLMLGLRAAGSAAGWGFQFQSAIFVAGTCWLLFAVGLNLAGLFEIGAGVAGLGQGFAGRQGHGGDFATGLLAVLVATPCTAPFMGAAVAGAVSAPPVIGIAVFLMMGVGLALPYLLIALLPGFAARLPRPGHWMVVLRQALSFPIFASCAWLAWVAAIEAGDRAVLVLAAGMVLLGMAGWLLGLSQKLSMRRPGFCVAAAALAALAALALLPSLAAAGPQPATGPQAATGLQATGASAGSEPFSEARLASLRGAGRPVFVDMTAAWCVTCLVNERIALAPASVREAFRSHRVAFLKGDWTRRNPQVTGFLRAHGRDGVPFYVYYPAGGEGRALPQLLTANRVLHEIDGPT